MEYKNNSLLNELGSSQSEISNAEKGIFVLVTLSKISEDDDQSIRDEDEILANDDEEEIMPSLKAKRNPWNSATFDSEDFFAGTIPA